MYINIQRGGNVFVSEPFLYGFDVRTCLYQFGGMGMPQAVVIKGEL